MLAIWCSQDIRVTNYQYEGARKKDIGGISIAGVGNSPAIVSIEQIPNFSVDGKNSKPC
jgi:hypothetical protein